MNTKLEDRSEASPSQQKPPPPWLKLRNELRVTSKETRDVLPTILSAISHVDTTRSSKHHITNLRPLVPQVCPGYVLPDDDMEAGRKGTRIRVLDADTFDAALSMQPFTTVSSVFPSTSSNDDDDDGDNDDDMEIDSSPQPAATKPVAILNLASEKHAGGGWLNGALAQEEALCYRSSLYLSLHPEYYPIPRLGAMYTPSCVIIRDGLVITLAAIRRPRLSADEQKFADVRDRELTKTKVRVVLRVAVLQGHTKIVLGALGCGAFYNPPREVAECFIEVLREPEFAGGWWEDVVFAVLDNKKGDKGGKDGEGNFGVFYRALHGEVV
ncbi:hypothetical protein P154DRAFT_434917 [Amniculicola lignicola CBS 123094]|uniref:Microbial-type PARG catalytic domain-containing protein n=1 Tax=Amniculicola lignicola CBS 123094 TaxID=1392246 RepID=A0A6A5WMN4_9PLEO|nr:hypothetical protein P154DRAFT_434917 [Amniculicola lignicola CBS 123094]